MRKKIVSLVAFLVVITSSVISQKNEFVFSYGENKVSYDEFKRGLLKNQSPDKKEISEADVRDYLNLYVNFKLKVQNALDKQMDTSKNFITELAMYRKQIARPFLTDKAVTDQLMKEAYERMQYEVNASHILIMVKNFDNVSDSLRAHKLIDSVRNLIETGTMDFAKAAQLFSEDPSAKFNKGELGYFSAFEMVYPFESMAYNTPLNKVSPIFKTDFGYHIVNVHDKRPSLGEIKVSHIMIKLNVNADEEEIAKAMAKADGIYQRIQSGEKTFEEMVKLFSEDNSSSQVGGELGWFKRTSQYPAEFKEAAFLLKNNGDYSRPVKTGYGVHLIKRVDLRPIEPFDKLKNSLTQRINRDSRSQQNTLVVFNRVSNELKLKENLKEFDRFTKSHINDKLGKAEWKYTADKRSKKVLFNFADKKVTVEEFAKYIEENQSPIDNPDVLGLTKKHYKNFVINSVMTFYEENLEKYNSEFKYLLQEYKEGILLFSLMDEVIWTKSMQDSAGLKAFFEKNRDDYKWSDRFEITMYVTSDKKVESDLISKINAGIADDSIIAYYKVADPLGISVRKGKFAQGDDELMDNLFAQADAQNTTGNYFFIFKEGDISYIIRANRFMPAGLKELDEVKGPATSDYQDILESQWIDSLKEKYPVKINEKVVKKLVTDLNK